MIAAAHLASSPEVVRGLVPGLGAFHAGKVVVFNGRHTPKNHLWGDVMGKITGRVMDEFPSLEEISDALIALDQPLLVVMDELPAYLEFVSAASPDAGENMRVLRLTTRFIASLIDAARSKRVITSSRTRVAFVLGQLDGAYEGGVAELDMALGDVMGEVRRGETTITPVDLSTVESLLALKGEDSHVGTLNARKRVKHREPQCRKTTIRSALA
jgi:hypothetical protein